MGTTAAERMTGLDASYLHLERADTPMHTLKVMIVDPSHRGRDLTLDELADVLPRHLGLVRRASQVVVWAPGFRSKPFWVDATVDVRRHLEERVAAAPGDRAALDAICSELATARLDRDRPLWAVTLVHGLADGRQALIVRVHHSVMDGIAALNSFLTATTPTEDIDRAPTPPLPPAPALPQHLVRQAARDALRAPAKAAHAARLLRGTRRTDRGFGDLSELPSGMVPRRSFNTPSGEARLCASTSLELASLKAVARGAGVTLNGALHGVIALAAREEALARGEDVSTPMTVMFSVAEDTSSGRRHGNGLASTRAQLRTDLEDPRAIVEATGRSCVRSVELRRARGFALTHVGTDITGRLGPRLRELTMHRIKNVPSHVNTANLAGPDHVRWLGDLPVVDWVSFAVAVSPSDLNLTGYSYNGRFTIGFICTPESMPDPRAFLDRLQPAIDRVLATV